MIKKMRRNGGWRMFAGVFFSLVLLAGFSGCSGLRGGSSGYDAQGVAADTGSPLYYGFNDVLIPPELRSDQKNSYILQSHGFSAGILSFKGRVDRGSLVAFFRENMLKDNWKPTGSFISSRTILLYEKQNRWCVIYITEGDFYTNVEVGVIPRVEEGSGELIR